MLLNSIFSERLTLEGYLISLAAALALGAVTALAFTYRNRTTSSMVTTLVLLPAAVQTVILLVNGNLGVGIAVAGAFSLVRFRSAPGSARDISALFIAMAIGLALGTGYLLAAAVFTVLMGFATLLLARLRLGEAQDGIRELKITVPENLDYETLFDDLLSRYTRESELTRVRTTNMGTLYELTYRVLMSGDHTREFLDNLRIRNGNLTVSLSRGFSPKEEL